MIATDGGLAVIAFDVWTLAEKAAHYQAMIYPRHSRYGLVAASLPLKIFGDIRSYQQKDSDNDGLCKKSLFH